MQKSGDRACVCVSNTWMNTFTSVGVTDAQLCRSMQPSSKSARVPKRRVLLLFTCACPHDKSRADSLCLCLPSCTLSPHLFSLPPPSFSLSQATVVQTYLSLTKPKLV